MYQLILTIQCASIVVLFAESWVVFKNWKGMLHAYLFLGCTTTLVNNVGYLFELLARSEDAYFTALCLSYLGRVWIAFALLLFIAELVQFRIPRLVKSALALFNVAIYVVVLTTRSTGLFYKKGTWFSLNGQFPIFHHENGIWHHFMTAMLFFYILLGLYLLVAARRQEDDATSKRRLLAVLLAILVQGVLVFFEMLKLLPVTEVYDITMLSFPISAVFMFIAIFRYNLLDTESLVRQYVVDELSEGIIATDARGVVQYYNKPALSLFPTLQEQPQRVVETIRAAIDSDEPLRMQQRIFRPEANTLSQDGAASGTIYALVDETEHYRYMDELREQKRIADTANRAKSSFLANMSHEIRTPINAILGMDEMILRESSEDQIVSYAGDIQNAGSTLLSIINDILDLSKVEEGKMEILPAQYSLGSLINDLANMLRPRAEKKGLRFTVDVDETAPNLLFGDEIRIRQCALNLLTNAVKYTETGTVTLCVGYEKCAEDRISLHIRVSDTGIGMKPEDMEQLFAPFARIEELRNRSIEGTGLGMSITKQLLALMDSRLEVESVYGSGSTFSFAVEQPVIRWEPVGSCAKHCEANAPRKAYRELFHAPDARILVVDDTPVNLAVIRGLLKKTLVQVVTASSGKEALAKAAQEPFDAFLIDHMMPEMDGVETLHALRKLPETVGKPCIALTANALSGAREAYLAEGFDDYLAKPVDGKLLEKALQSCLPAEKLHDPGEALPTVSPIGPATVLVVDDDPLICHLAEQILGKYFQVKSCSDGKAAADQAESLRPDLILLDINLGDMTGFDVLHALRRRPTTGAIPVVFLTGESNETAEINGFRNGAADFVRKPFVPEVLLQRTRRIIELSHLQSDLQSEVKRQTLRAERLTKEMMLALSKTVDAKDHYTNGHSERVAAYSAEIARRMGKSAREQEHIYEMGLMHDIGKIGVPEEIINKASRLTDEEFAVIQRHTVIGSEILRLITEMPELADGARSHHEKYNGTGYPDGLSGADIPEAARIICLADCYDAMTSTRTYSSPKPQAKVRAEIERCAGTQFDPEIAKVLLSMIDEDTDYVMNERGADIRIWRGSDRLWVPSIEEPRPAVHSAAAPAATDDDASVALPDWLYAVDGLDVASGIRHCGTEDTYLDTLTIYAENAAGNADEIEHFWNAGDVANTVVKVHALKSTSRAVGAEDLGALAEKLELAGKAGDTAILDTELGDLLARFRALAKSLAPLHTTEQVAEDMPDATDEQLREAYDALREFAANLDTDGAVFVLDRLDGFRLPEAERTRCNALRRAVESFAWEQIDTLLA